MEEMIRQLVDQLNQWSKEYYEEDNPTVTDAQWDAAFDNLKTLEEQTGIILPDSPTQKVSGAPQGVNGLHKVKHSSPMLSANKTTDIQDIYKFLQGREFVQSYKEDGLTIVLRYEGGVLKQAITRGDGYIGEDVTHNFKVSNNIPQTIKYQEYLEVRGEAVISWEDFDTVNEKNGGIYSHPRNLASGAVRQLDPNVFKERMVDFLAFTLVNWKDIGVKKYDQSIEWLKKQGFHVVPTVSLAMMNDKHLMDRENYGYPTDGWIFRYNDLKYGESLGGTAHHPNYMMALKPALTTYSSKFRGIDYKVNRNGVVSLTAEFDTVIIDGANVNRASVHNVDIFDNFEFGVGDDILVYKANEIIPQIYENKTRSGTYKLIENCPCCGSPLKITRLSKTSKTNVLLCDNLACSARQLARFDHFVSKPCMNIDGLSESTLDVLLEEGLLKNFKDIYHLKEHRDELESLDRFGKKKVDNLLNSIEKSRSVKLENYLNALGIPNIGKSAAKTISEYFKGDVNAFFDALKKHFCFVQLDDFGETMHDSIYTFFSKENPSRYLLANLIEELNFVKEEKSFVNEDDFINGKTFVVTGSFKTMARSQLEKIITDHGGKLSGSVSKKTDYLLTNDADSGSSKAVKAKELNIPIMSEDEFLEKLK